jgi:hypothetical protein
MLRTLPLAERPPSICADCGDLAVDYQGAPSECDFCGTAFCGEHLTFMAIGTVTLATDTAQVSAGGWACSSCATARVERQQARL